MLDPAFIRDHIEEVRTGLRNRGLEPDKVLQDIATLEGLRRRLIAEFEGLKRQQNTSGDERHIFRRRAARATSRSNSWASSSIRSNISETPRC